MEDLLFIGADEGRYHDRILGGLEAGGLIVLEALGKAVGGLLDHGAAHMDGHKALLEEKLGIADGIIGAAVDGNVALDLEEAGIEATGSEALGIESDVLDHSVQLPTTRHGADKGTFGEDRIHTA